MNKKFLFICLKLRGNEVKEILIQRFHRIIQRTFNAKKLKLVFSTLLRLKDELTGMITLFCIYQFDRSYELSYCWPKF